MGNSHLDVHHFSPNMSQKEMKAYIIMAIKSTTNFTATGGRKVGINSINTYAEALSKYLYDEHLDLNNVMSVRNSILDSTKYGVGTKRKLISALRHISRNPTLKHDICTLNMEAKEELQEKGYVQKHQELIHPEDIVKHHKAAYDKCKVAMDRVNAAVTEKQRALRPREKRFLQEFILLWLVFMNVPRRSKLYLYLHHGPCPNIFEQDHNYLDMDKMELICNKYKTYAWYTQQILKLNNPKNNIYELSVDDTNEVLDFYKEHIYRHEISQSVFKLKETANNSSMVAKLQRITQKNITFQSSRKSFATFYIEENNRLTEIAYEMGHHIKTHLENYLLHAQARERGLDVPKHEEPATEKEEKKEEEGSESSNSVDPDMPDLPDFLKDPIKETPAPTRARARASSRVSTSHKNSTEDSDSSESELWTIDELKNSNNFEAEKYETPRDNARYPLRRTRRVSYRG
jgi:hypothetical protein